MHPIIFGIAILLQAIGSDATFFLGGHNPHSHNPHLHNPHKPVAAEPNWAQCNCDVIGKYIDIVLIERSHIQDCGAEEIVVKIQETLDVNYRKIYDILGKSACNFPYVQRGLQNVQQRVLEIIEIFKCPEQRKDSNRLDVAVEAFVSATNSMIADTRSNCRQLSQECVNLYDKIRPAACNTGENIIFAILNSLHK